MLMCDFFFNVFIFFKSVTFSGGIFSSSFSKYNSNYFFHFCLFTYFPQAYIFSTPIYFLYLFSPTLSLSIISPFIHYFVSSFIPPFLHFSSSSPFIFSKPTIHQFQSQNQFQPRRIMQVIASCKID